MEKVRVGRKSSTSTPNENFKTHKSSERSIRAKTKIAWLKISKLLKSAERLIKAKRQNCAKNLSNRRDGFKFSTSTRTCN